MRKLDIKSIERLEIRYPDSKQLLRVLGLWKFGFLFLYFPFLICSYNFLQQVDTSQGRGQEHRAGLWKLISRLLDVLSLRCL